MAAISSSFHFNASLDRWIGCLTVSVLSPKLVSFQLKYLMRYANIFAHFLIIPPTKFKRQGYSTHFEAAGHVIGDKEGVRKDGKFFLNSKLWCLFRFTKNYSIII
jgi:hypothetical protein